MAEKKKMKRWKKVLLIIGICMLVLVLGLGTTALILYKKNLPSIRWQEAYDFMNSDTGYTIVNTKLTEEQRLKDFDYMYDIVCLQNPKKELFEQAYGISYADIYETYKNYVLSAETDFEYFGYLAAFLSVLPGEHNLMKLPDYTRNAAQGEFCLTEIYATQELKEYTYS